MMITYLNHHFNFLLELSGEASCNIVNYTLQISRNANYPDRSIVCKIE